MGETLIPKGSQEPIVVNCRDCNVQMTEVKGMSFTRAQPAYRMACPKCRLGARIFVAHPAPLLVVWMDEIPQNVPFSEFVEEKMRAHLLNNAPRSMSPLDQMAALLEAKTA